MTQMDYFYPYLPDPLYRRGLKEGIRKAKTSRVGVISLLAQLAFLARD